MINEQLLEVSRYTGEGFQPLVYFNSWRVAVLNYMDALHPARINTMERHPATDEVFVLMRGRGILFLAGGETGIDEIVIQVMEPGTVYNVKPHCWHTIVLSRDASVLIVENADTGKHNSQFIQLQPSQRQLILETSQREQPEWSGASLST
jgi:ureidoglycolate hydrolase